MSTRTFRWIATFLGWLMLPVLGLAHPMGNFSVNHYSRIALKSDRITIQYFIDLAEIPAYQELQQGNITATANDPAVLRYVAERGAQFGRGLTLLLDGKPLPLRLTSSGVIFPPGAGGLPTMKMGFVYQAEYPSTIHRDQTSLRYIDGNYPGHTGWKEIVAVVESGTLLRTTVPAKDRSNELTDYPTDLLNSPPQDLEAALSFQSAPLEIASTSAPVQHKEVTLLAPSAALPVSSVPHGAAPTHAENGKPSPTSSGITTTAPGNQSPSTPSTVPATMQLKANTQQTPRSRFTELITAQKLSPWFLFTAAIIAVGLGGLHALEPGHGKTIVAAYLVGSRGTARHAMLLGIIVTVSHTAGVFALGAITLYASHYIVPEQLYPWLGVSSGIAIAGMGCYLFLRRLSGTAIDHSHADGVAHTHWIFSRRTKSADTQESADLESVDPDILKKQVSLTQLFTLGITGGIIPCPAALIVLLSAFALHRTGLGFFLIVAFSLGLAGVLISFGMLMVYARRFMTHLQMDGPLTKKWLPLASSAFITILGTVLAIQAFATTHVNLVSLSKDKLGPLLFVTGLGLILGMRHSTDADHVVAISTIVTRQRSIRNAAFIGSVWGLGHTITIFIVGSLIIIFGLEIPPRLGLSMEFSVALMLILLGVLNLSGLLKKITQYLTPAGVSSAISLEPAEPLTASAPKASSRNPVSRLGWYQCLRPLVIGLVHGLAGSAAVALLVLSTIHDPIWASIYLLIFGAGTMVGMMCMTAAIAVPLTYAGDRFAKLGHYLGVASGMASVCFGSFLVYQLGFLGGLFTSHPHWTPQ